MFDCNSFLNRKGWKQRELAQRLNIGTSTVGMWCTGKSTPSYDVVVQLIKLGMTADELLGSEIAGILIKNSEVDTEIASSIFDSPEFAENAKKILLEMQGKSNGQNIGKSNNFLDRINQDDTPTENM